MKDIESLLRSYRNSSGPTWEQVGNVVGIWFSSFCVCYFLFMVPSTMGWTAATRLTLPIAQFFHAGATLAAPLFILLVCLLVVALSVAAVLDYLQE